MSKQMNAFFIFGSANFQDLLPVLFRSLESDEDNWVCFFDCFAKKRQLATYTKEEVTEFIIGKCEELKCKKPLISFFRANDKARYESLYDFYSPTHVFVQEIKPKWPIWYPKADKSKVVHFAWWDESKHLYEPLIGVDVTILKRKEDVKYGYQNFNTKYFGNLRLDHLKYSSEEPRKNRCFIPETYLRMSDKYVKDSMQIVEFIDRLIPFLRNKGFEIVWKKREKGYPVENWSSPLDFCKEKPDIIIDKDLNFPSSLLGYAYESDICLVINDSFAFFDMVTVNTNCSILTTHGGRKQKIDDFFIEDYQDNIIDMKSDTGWDKLGALLQKSNEFVYEESDVSQKILDYVRSFS